MRYTFGDFELDSAGGQLNGPDGPVVLRRQAWNLLLALIEAAPALVSRDDLLDRVWGRSALSPNALPQTISELRQALGDRARDPKYIETCHGRGYRIVCPVRSHQPANTDSIGSPGQPPRHGHRRLLTGGAILTAVLAAGYLFWPDNQAGDVSGIARQVPASADALRRQAEAARQRHDPAAVAAHLRALSLVEPANLDVMLDLAAAELDALQSGQARQTLSLLGSDSAVRQEPRWLVLKARLAMIDGDADQALHLAEAAMSQAKALGEPAAGFSASLVLAGLHQRRGDLAEVLAVLADEDIQALLIDHPQERAKLTLKAVAALREQGRLESAGSKLERLAEAVLDDELRQRVEIEQALLGSLGGQPEQALVLLQQQLADLPTTPNPDLAIELHNALGQVGVEVGAFEQALGSFERAMTIARSSGRGQRVAGLQVNAGALLARRDRFAEAERLWQASLDVFEQLGDRRGQAVVLGNLAAAASAQGLNERSQALNEQALEIFRDLDLDGPRARTAFNLALVAAREGALEQAEALFAEAYEGYRRIGQFELMLHVGASRIDYRVLAGDLLLAEALLLELEELVTRGSPLRQAGVHASAGRLALWRGDLESSRRAFERARVLRAETGHDTWLATSDLELLQIDLLAGANPWQVRVSAAELAELFERRGQTRAAARSRLLMIEALLSEGEKNQAEAELARLRQDARQFSDASLALDLDWVEVWVAREEERLPRLEALARKASRQGFLGKLAQIEASVEARGIAMLDDESTRLAASDAGAALVVVLPPYVVAGL